MTITLTEHKRQMLWKAIKMVLRQPQQAISVQQLARIIGCMVAIFPASEVAALHYRTLERFKIRCLSKGKSWSSKLLLNSDCLKELRWWHTYLRQGCPSKSLVPHKYDLKFFSDASGNGWGALVAGDNANSPFSEKQKELSINTKELLAIYLGLQVLADKIRDRKVLCFCDNVTAVSCINKFGSQNVIRGRLVVAIFSLVEKLNCKISAMHLAGSSNSAADS